MEGDREDRPAVEAGVEVAVLGNSAEVAAVGNSAEVVEVEAV